jgi:hypothetical protein
MSRARWEFLPLLWLMTGCGANERAGLEEAASGETAAASGLEKAALDSGVVADAQGVSPTGLYRQRHEAGRDSLCIVRGDDGKMHFALEAVFGENTQCRGNGMLRAAGDKLIMNFARSACLVVARYDGDRVAMPGVLDVECNALCTQRGTLEGVSFPRVSREESVARAAKRDDGSALCS